MRWKFCDKADLFEEDERREIVENIDIWWSAFQNKSVFIVA
jgi:hypothetical protein